MATKRFMDAISWNGIITGLAKFFACTEDQSDRCDNA